MSSTVATCPPVYADLYPLVSRVVRAMLGVDADQDDVFQTALLHVFLNIDSVRDSSCLESWVAAVAANTARHEIRSRQRRRRFFEKLTENSPLPSYEPDFDHGFRQVDARRLFETIPPREREVLTLWLLGAGTIAQIAGHVGCSLSTARRRLQRARRALARFAT